MNEHDLNSLREKYQHIARELAALYGFPTWRQHYPPVDELIDCILSQSTNDANRDRAFALLKAKFPEWEQVRDAAAADVINAIKPAGLANQKGPRIQEVLREITAQHGKITLDFLREMPVENAKKWLTSLHGVGPKTAAIVLCFAFGQPAFPVDTHVHRVSQRLGLIGARVTADQAHDIMEQIVPADTYYQAHLNIIEHGRKVCQARRPACERCPLTIWCDHYQQFVKPEIDAASKAYSAKKPHSRIGRTAVHQQTTSIPGSKSGSTMAEGTGKHKDRNDDVKPA